MFSRTYPQTAWLVGHQMLTAILALVFTVFVQRPKDFGSWSAVILKSMVYVSCACWISAVAVPLVDVAHGAYQGAQAEGTGQAGYLGLWLLLLTAPCNP